MPKPGTNLDHPPKPQRFKCQFRETVTQLRRPPYKLLIDIRPAPDRPGSQLVSVLSRPVSAMPYPDGDSVQQLADSVLRAVPGRTDTDPTDHFTD